jgi:hypothetical protein
MPRLSPRSDKNQEFRHSFSPLKQQEVADVRNPGQYSRMNLGSCRGSPD